MRFQNSAQHRQQTICREWGRKKRMHSKMLEHYAMTANGTAPEIVDGDTREDYKAFGIEYHKHEPYVVNDVDSVENSLN